MRKPTGKKTPHARGEGGNGGLRCNIEAVLKYPFLTIWWCDVHWGKKEAYV